MFRYVALLSLREIWFRPEESVGRKLAMASLKVRTRQQLGVAEENPVKNYQG